MSKSSEQTDAKIGGDGGKKPVPMDIKLTLLSSAVSATLRLVIPVMGLFLLGLAVDAMLGQMATWAIVGAVVGFLIAAYLIYLQMKKIQKNEKAKIAAEEKSAIKPETGEEKLTVKSSATAKTTKKKSSAKKSSGKTASSSRKSSTAKPAKKPLKKEESK